MARAFDFLTLHLYLDEAEPPDFDPGGFLVAPRISWGDWRFGRAFLHESLHYWQLLGSRYLSRLVDTEWRRIEYFETGRRILPPDGTLAGLYDVDLEVGFSANQLMESWTRFWEIHIQDPSQVLSLEDIALSGLDPGLLAPSRAPGRRPFPWQAVEVAMTHGANSAVYGEPFRWMLDQVFAETGHPRPGPESPSPGGTGPAYLCCVAFPILVHAAFQHPHPVLAFKRAVQALCGGALDMPVCRGLGAQYVEWDWFREYETLSRLVPAPDDGLVPSSEDAVRFHRAMAPPSTALAHAVRKGFEALQGTDLAEQALDEAADLLACFHDPVIFAFMGVRPFRMGLAHVAPPPIVYFGGEGMVLKGFRLDAEQNERVESAVMAASDAAERVGRFRAAERAAALNLPLDAFSRSA